MRAGKLVLLGLKDFVGLIFLWSAKWKFVCSLTFHNAFTLFANIRPLVKHLLCLQTFDLSSNRWTFLDFCSKFSRDEKFKAVEKMKERESLFNEFITDLRKRAKMDTKTAHEQVIKPRTIVRFVPLPVHSNPGLGQRLLLIGLLWISLTFKITVKL